MSNFIRRKEMFITITGELGSGKSTVAKVLEQKYGFLVHSTGTVQREIAKDMGMTTLELNKYMAEHLDNDYDKLIDNKTIEIAKERATEKIVFDSRMAWHFVPNSLKVFIIVDKYTAAKRVIAANRGVEEKYSSLKEAVDALQERKAIEDKRFQEMYQANTTDFHNFDLIIDSTEIMPDEIAELIYEYVTAKKEEKRTILVSPKRLYPTIRLAKIKEEEEQSIPKVVFVNKTFHIVSGHQLCMEAIQKKDSLIKVELLDVIDHVIAENSKNLKEVLTFDLDLYTEWEEKNQIKFDEYPLKY